MADVACVLDAEYIRGNSWAFAATGTGNIAGGDDGFVVKGAQVPQIVRMSRDLIIEGVSVAYLGAAAHPVYTQLYADPGGLLGFYFDGWTTTLAQISTRHVINLGMPVLAQDNNGFLRLAVADTTGAGMDVCILGAYGRFGVSQAPEPSAQLVTVEGYSWPLKRRLP
jgi:hypothetical protein